MPLVACEGISPTNPALTTNYSRVCSDELERGIHTADGPSGISELGWIDANTPDPRTTLMNAHMSADHVTALLAPSQPK
jgi:hypothetical protein